MLRYKCRRKSSNAYPGNIINKRGRLRIIAAVRTRHAGLLIALFFGKKIRKQELCKDGSSDLESYLVRSVFWYCVPLIRKQASFATGTEDWRLRLFLVFRINDKSIGSAECFDG